MSAQQIQNFRLIKQILFQLRKFGLNPYDWKIDRGALSQNSEFSIRHKSDDEFRFVGQWEMAQEGKCQLVYLGLASL